MLGHVPDQFPSACVTELITAIKTGQVIRAEQCGRVLAWALGQLKTDDGFGSDPEAVVKLQELNATLESALDIDSSHEASLIMTMLVGHVPDQFPSECVTELITAIKTGQVIRAVQCGLVVLAWALGQLKTDDGFGSDPEAVVKLQELNATLESALDIDSSHEASPIMTMLVMQAVKLIVAYIQKNGGMDWIIEKIEELLNN